MPNSLTPCELNPGEWLISYPEWFEKYGYEEFGCDLFPTREACQHAIDRLNAALPALLIAAVKVVQRWEGGDLAEAVRDLGQVLETAWGRQ